MLIITHIHSGPMFIVGRHAYFQLFIIDPRVSFHTNYFFILSYSVTHVFFLHTPSHPHTFTLSHPHSFTHNNLQGILPSVEEAAAITNITSAQFGIVQEEPLSEAFLNPPTVDPISIGLPPPDLRKKRQASKTDGRAHYPSRKKRQTINGISLPLSPSLSLTHTHTLSLPTKLIFTLNCITIQLWPMIQCLVMMTSF